ncbi:hypothetical protein NOVA_36035 [Nocardia nova]|uniref:hypothetical protein n=1 Tax=Nocardia nova TaxID=37330 RepID=UPI001C461A8D|nr:hypothetical protein [Nocardia nova]MBV7708199.1 hypothetical protein [Nocardia nova]
MTSIWPQLYRCSNAYCTERFHYSRVCPHPYAPRVPMSEADYQNHVRVDRMWLEGDFDLNRTPSYMRERVEKRAELAHRKPHPGYGWLLVLVPAMLLVAVVMGALILYL